MIPVLGIPYFNRPDLLLRCLDSIDHPVGRVVLGNLPVGQWRYLGANERF